MAVDLNAIREKLKRRSKVGVTANGQITPTDPQNDGTKNNSAGETTLKSRRFYIA